MSSVKTVKRDEKTGWYIDRVHVGGTVWFLKDRKGNAVAHGKYRPMLECYKISIKEAKNVG